MDKTALFVISVPSLVVTGLFVIFKLINGKKLLGGDCFDVFWKSAAFVGSLLTVIAQFSDAVKAVMGNMPLYVIAACVFLCAETFEALRKKFKA
jgi:hypothetical protein